MDTVIAVVSSGLGGFMIISFGDRVTEDLFHNRTSRRVLRFPPDVAAAAVVKMDMLNGAASLIDLRSPPGNRLEGLKGNWKGWHSIRVNDQWRLVFRWSGGDAHEVRLLDYH
jgi:proteic killer suppression protein